MQKTLVSNYYNRDFDESQIINHDFSTVAVTFNKQRWLDISKPMLESEGYYMQTLNHEEVKEREIFEIKI